MLTLSAPLLLLATLFSSVTFGSAQSTTPDLSDRRLWPRQGGSGGGSGGSGSGNSPTASSPGLQGLINADDEGSPNRGESRRFPFEYPFPVEQRDGRPASTTSMETLMDDTLYDVRPFKGSIAKDVTGNRSVPNCGLWVLNLNNQASSFFMIPNPTGGFEAHQLSTPERQFAFAHNAAGLDFFKMNVTRIYQALSLTQSHRVSRPPGGKRNHAWCHGAVTSLRSSWKKAGLTSVKAGNAGGFGFGVGVGALGVGAGVGLGAMRAIGRAKPWSASRMSSRPQRPGAGEGQGVQMSEMPRK